MEKRNLTKLLPAAAVLTAVTITGLKTQAENQKSVSSSENIMNSEELGPYVENAEEFPEKVNLQICHQIDKGNLDIEIWERGSGYTKASGTGSCAAAIAAYRRGLMENRINVNQPGGMIQIDIKEDGTIFMTGTVGYIADVSVAESFFS